MTIYDKDKLIQNPPYPTKITSSYADITLLEMGAELEEEVVDSISDLKSLSNIDVGTENEGNFLIVDSNGGIDFVDSDNYANYQLSNVDPGQAIAGQVLAVNTNADGVEWVTISNEVTAHTYTNFGALVTDIMAHPQGHLYYSYATPILFFVKPDYCIIYPATHTEVVMQGSNAIKISRYKPETFGPSSTSKYIYIEVENTVITFTINDGAIQLSSNKSTNQTTETISNFIYYY